MNENEKVELTIMVSPFEKQAIKDLAKAEQLGVSKFVVSKVIGLKVVKRKRKRI